MTASKSIKLSLRQQAIQTVHKRDQRELRREINREYRRLLYDSQMLKADRKTILKIKTLRKSLPSAYSMGGAFVRNRIGGILDDYVKQRKYHPRTFKEIEKYTQTGEWPASILGEDPDA